MGFTLGKALLAAALLGAVRSLLLVRCPVPGDKNLLPYCACSNTTTTVTIKCDFRKKEDVLLTKELLEPYANLSLTSAYVRMVNATSVDVRSDFVQTWLDVPSAAFDIWHSGSVILHPTPRLPNVTNDKSKSMTFAGVGIVGCYIPVVPPMFLRDRLRGAFRIKESSVGVVRAGFLDNITQMRYIVMDDSVVGEVEGPVAAEGYVTLSMLEVHNWHGLILTNVTINKLGPAAFNLTHMRDLEVVQLIGCHIGRMAKGALTVVGEVNVTILNNEFRFLDRGAFKVHVMGNVLFDGNTMRARALDALEDLRCYNTSSIQNNTIVVDTPPELSPSASAMVFHPSCGSPQLFLVMDSSSQLLVLVDTRAAWVLGAALAALVMAMVVGAVWFIRGKHSSFAMSRLPIHLKGHNHRTSMENLPKNIELSIPREDSEGGSSVKDLEMASESREDSEALQCDNAPSEDAHSGPSSDDATATVPMGQDCVDFLGDDLSNI